MRWASLALAAAVLASGACGDSSGDTNSGSLHGKVRDAQSGKAIRGATVTFTADTLEEVETHSGDNGSYQLDVSAVSPLGRLTAAKSGYETRVESVYVDDGNVEIDLLLNRK